MPTISMRVYACESPFSYFCWLTNATINLSEKRFLKFLVKILFACISSASSFQFSNWFHLSSSRNFTSSCLSACLPTWLAMLSLSSLAGVAGGPGLGKWQNIFLYSNMLLDVCLEKRYTFLVFSFFFFPFFLTTKYAWYFAKEVKTERKRVSERKK